MTLPDIGTALGRARANWGWFIVLGLVLLLGGFIAFANLFAATLVSIIFIGAAMLVGGISQLIHAMKVPDWGRSLFWLLSGLLYAAAGAVALFNPILASAALTLLLGVAMIVAGLCRIWVGLMSAAGAGRWWIALGGLVTALAGLVIATGWPVSGLWVFGLILAIDLTVQGCAAIVFGWMLKARS